MSTTIGNRMINGAGVKYHTVGNGVVRDVGSAIVGTIGHALVNKLVSAVKGSGFKITGQGKKKPGRPRKVGRPKKK